MIMNILPGFRHWPVFIRSIDGCLCRAAGQHFIPEIRVADLFFAAKPIRAIVVVCHRAMLHIQGLFSYAECFCRPDQRPGEKIELFSLFFDIIGSRYFFAAGFDRAVLLHPEIMRTAFQQHHVHPVPD